MDECRSKRVISVRTPVVLFEKPEKKEAYSPDKCVSNFKVTIKNSQESNKTPSNPQNSTPERKSFSTRNTRSLDPGFHERKQTCGQILLNDQNFIVLRGNKYRQHSGNIFKEKRKSYQEILSNISSRIKKLRSDERLKNKSVEYDYEENLQIFRLKPVFSPILPYTRKKLRAVKRDF